VAPAPCSGGATGSRIYEYGPVARLAQTWQKSGRAKTGGSGPGGPPFSYLRTNDREENSMPETLLTSHAVLLYGRKVLGVTLAKASEAMAMTAGETADTGAVIETAEAPAPLGSNKFLEHQLEAEDACLARIYAFSFEGHYYDLPKPAIFLVHGDGSDPEATRPANSRAGRAPADADRTGVANSPGSFSEDIRVWTYDKGDFSLRLDPDSGTLEQILLERCLGGGSAYGGGAYGGGAYGGGAYGGGAYGGGAYGGGAYGVQRSGSARLRRSSPLERSAFAG
jgi:hypothetical protein